MPPSLSRGVSQLTLTHFRSYEKLTASFACSPIILTGPNGAGKTNLLEALSFLIPGRGLRRARLSTVRYQGRQDPWAISCHLKDGDTPLHIGTGQDPEAGKGERRISKINGEKIKNHGSLAEWVSMVWLTPHMDRLFLDAPQERRRFLDRLVYGVDAAHAERLNRYERALKERNLLLRSGNYDGRWMEGIEDILVREGILITLKRQETLSQLRTVLTSQNQGLPPLALSLDGPVETLLYQVPPQEVPERLRRALFEKRQKDGLSGRTSLGPHLSDLCVVYVDKNQPASLCSTGEQKSMLLSIVMASAHLLSLRTGAIPLLLLDEVIAHLDENRRALLCETLLQLNMQVWLTGTESSFFEGLRGRAQFLQIREGALEEA